MIEAFFFGTGKDQLFATYHPPAGGSARGLTVICPPLFAEYMRTQLVLRVDYRGTGDSFGELAEVAISDWLEDILLAVREGCDLSGSNIVQLVGVRAGALLACKAAGVSGDVQRVVLWDPVPDGAEYLEILRRIR